MRQEHGAPIDQYSRTNQELGAARLGRALDGVRVEWIQGMPAC
jgi:hypothetical protein